MMKNIFVLSILFLCGNMIFASGKHEAVDVEICIIDSETSEPLKNISVICMIEKSKRVFFILDEITSIIESQKYVTDENGTIRIPGKKFRSLKTNEAIYATHIYVNIDTMQEFEAIDNISSLDRKDFNLSRHFLSNTRNKYLFPNSDYYAARIAVLYRYGDRYDNLHIYIQVADDYEAKKRIQSRSYNTQKVEGEKIIIELVRQPEVSTNSKQQE